MKLWERFKRWCHGVPPEPKGEFPWQQYFVIHASWFSFDNGKPMYVRGERLPNGNVQVTTEELHRAGLDMGGLPPSRTWVYGEPFDRVAEISWDTFKTMRKLGD